MAEGTIIKALSGFYYVHCAGQIYTCRARGKFRHGKLSPLVGDRVRFTELEQQTGALDEVLPRVNQFVRPAVANVDQLVIIVSQAIPVTDPFLIDRIITVAASRGCDCVVCINKCDLDTGKELFDTYQAAGYPTVRVSAETGEGIDQLRRLITGKVSAFTGNSGVGKSSILNALSPSFALDTGEVSEKLGRGRHTTRHVELFALDACTLIADTPGFSSFDADGSDLCRKEELADFFPEFSRHADACRFPDCAHLKGKGCGVLEAVARGEIAPSRHASYVRLYEQAGSIPEWERQSKKE